MVNHHKNFEIHKANVEGVLKGTKTTEVLWAVVNLLDNLAKEAQAKLEKSEQEFSAFEQSFNSIFLSNQGE